MLSAEDNKLLTEVGHGTPMGELMRRYWHPIAATAELDDHPTKPVRVLGEDLVLYKDRSGTLGLIDRLCAHRRVDLSYGIPEEHGLRCMYHGWLYDETGQCIAQPFEETVHPDGRFKEKVRMKGYPVRDFAGLLWAYLGPEPAPLIPMWEPFTWDDGFVDIGIVELPCNWLQCQENSLDPVHLEWLHGYWGVRQREDHARKLGHSKPEEFGQIPKRHLKIGLDMFEYGVIKRRVVEGTSEDHGDWRVGHPVLFPNVLLVGNAAKCSLQFRVPVDDENTFHVTWSIYRTAPGHQAKKQDRVPYWYIPLRGADGRLVTDLVNHQDYAAWVIQGAVADRTKERLGESDKGIILYRKLLKEQVTTVIDGGDPMGIIRRASMNKRIDLPLEQWQSMANPARLTTYFPEDSGQPPDQIAAIEEVLSTWQGQTPWVSKSPAS